MEELAGDIVLEYLRVGNIPDTQKIFHNVEVLWLLIDFEKLTCAVYKLNMDFVRRSELFIGNKELNLNEATNRMLATLEQRE